MEKLIEKIINMGMEQFAENTRKEIVMSDEVIRKDLEDEKSLEQRYEDLNIPTAQRMLINDYISCMQTTDSRHSEIAYMAGIKDAVCLLVHMGLLKNSKVSASLSV